MLGFRVWDYEKNKFVNEDSEGLVMLSSGDLCEVFIANNLQMYHNMSPSFQNRYIPMQSTGLKDENDIEIYQKDIVKFEMEETKRAFADIVSDLFDFYGFYYELERPFRVYKIGNVYQNFDLVNKVMHPQEWHVNGGLPC